MNKNTFQLSLNSLCWAKTALRTSVRGSFKNRSLSETARTNVREQVKALRELEKLDYMP